MKVNDDLGIPELEASELVGIDIVANPGRRPEPVHDLTLQRAQVGDTYLVPADREIPPGWEVSDGRPRASDAYPEFVAAMGVTRLTFTLPPGPTDRPDLVAIVRLH